MNDDPVMTAWEKRQELRLAAEAAPEPADEDVAYAAHVLSEWLDDAAPLHEQRYRDPAKAVLKFAASREQARAPDEGAVAEAAKALADRLRAIHDDPIYTAVWTLNHFRNGPYTGPKYDRELDALERALSTTGGQK